MKRASPSSRVGRRLSRRRVGETPPASDTDCDEPAVARDSTAQQCDRPPSNDTGSHIAQPLTSSLLPLELSCVPSTRIEECLAWLAGHTHFDPAQTTAALCSLYDQQPLMLLSGDTFADCEARHDSLCEILRRTHVQPACHGTAMGYHHSKPLTWQTLPPTRSVLHPRRDSGNGLPPPLASSLALRPLLQLSTPHR